MEQASEITTQLALLSCIDRLGVLYAVLHGAEDLYGSPASDIDMVVASDHVPRVLSEIAASDEFCLLQCIEYEAECYGLVLGVRSASGNQNYLVLDICSDYRWGGRIIFPQHTLLARRIRTRDFYSVAPETEVAFLLVKKLYEKDHVPFHQRQRISELVAALGPKADEQVKVTFGEHMGETLMGWLRQNNWHAIESNISSLRRALRRTVSRHDRWNHLRYWCSELARRSRRIAQPTGLHIAFLGPDGAGKSTLVGLTVSGLGAAFRQSTVFHFRPQLVPKRNTPNQTTMPHSQAPYSLIRSLVMLTFHCADFVLGYVLKVWPTLIRSTLIIFDRYYHDILVDPFRYRLRLPSRIAWWLERIVPEPAMVFALAASAEHIWKRKQEISFATLTQQCDAYRTVAAQMPNALLLDAGCTAEQLSDQVRSICWDYLHERCQQRAVPLLSRQLVHQNIAWLANIMGLRATPTDTSEGSQNSQSSFQFTYVDVGEGRGYLFPAGSVRLRRRAMEIYNAQSFSAKTFRALVSRIPGAILPRTYHVSLVSCADRQNHRSPINLFADIASALGHDRVAIAISLGTPGPHRKPVLRVMTPDGDLLAYVKIGWNMSTKELLDTECDTLDRIGSLSPRSFQVPKVLERRARNGLSFLFLNVPHSHAKPFKSRFHPRHGEILLELSSIDRTAISLKASRYWERLCLQANTVVHPYWRHTILKVLQEIDQRFGDFVLPMHRSHGDFAPWNIVYHGDQITLFDWEYSRVQSPGGWDFFHFISQSAIHLAQTNPISLYDATLTENKTFLHRYKRSLGVDDKTFLNLLFLYFVERLVQIVSRTPDSFHKARAIMTALNMMYRRI